MEITASHKRHVNLFNANITKKLCNKRKNLLQKFSTTNNTQFWHGFCKKIHILFCKKSSFATFLHFEHLNMVCYNIIIILE